MRVVVATNRDLTRMVEEGKFRQDLFFRLSVARIALPPLRERREDIPLLVERLVQRAARESAKAVTGVSQAAIELLSAHDWPGNVRELAHVLERAVVLARHEVLTSEDFPVLHKGARDDGGSLVGTVPLGDRPTLDELKRRYVLSVLAEQGGNVSRAAIVLGIDRRSLHRMLVRFGRTTRARAGDAVAADGDERDDSMA